jgi:prophage maintenance system killer protein
MEKEIIRINEELGGKIVRGNSLSWACDKVKEENNVFKKNAYLIRAIVIDHPFTDMNKSTATIISLRNFKLNNIKCNEDLLLLNIKRIVKKNITDIKIIERVLRRCCQKKK